MPPDPWTAFLDWLTTVLVPDWGELISLLPYVVFGTIVGPILTIIVLMWGWYLVTRRRGRVKRVELQPVPAPRDGVGAVSVPPNVPTARSTPSSIRLAPSSAASTELS